MTLERAVARVRRSEVTASAIDCPCKPCAHHLMHAIYYLMGYDTLDDGIPNAAIRRAPIVKDIPDELVVAVRLNVEDIHKDKGDSDRRVMLMPLSLLPLKGDGDA